MSALDELPNRRVEGWRWSDLRAALTDAPDLKIAPGADHPILRLARAARTADVQAVRGGEPTVLMDVADERHAIASRQIQVGDGARLDRALFHAGAADHAAANLIQIRMEGGAQCRLFVLSEGARFSRLEAEIDVLGPGARIEIAGVYLVEQGRHADLTSLVTLHAPGAEVRQVVRGVARKGGRGVFQGKFRLERAAQKTSAEMQHNALLLEEGAEVFAKPELEIYADDVQCAHGNTAGQMDEQAVFYLRSRGLPEAEARALIVRAFLVAALPDWLPDAARHEAERRIDLWLERRS